MHQQRGTLARRRFLEIMGVAGGVVALRSVWSAAPALADESQSKLLLFVYFGGGWDQLCALDPRSNTLYKDNTGNHVFPGYDLLVDPGVKSVLAATGDGVQKKGNLSFGPAVPPAFIDKHYADLSIVRGVMMDTLTHEVGRRYFITGKFPRGLSANGSALPTMAASLQGDGPLLPHLSISLESYNDGQPAFASPIQVNDKDDIFKVLSPLGKKLDPTADAALQAFEAASATCEHQTYDGAGLVGMYKGSRAKARNMVSSTEASLFDYSFAAPPPGDLFSTLGVTSQADLSGPKGKAVIAALALENGISQAVGLQLVENLDDHSDWDLNHGTTLWSGFEALGNLISYLKATDYKGTGGGKVWDRTTMVVFSEFARGPRLNPQNGRSHHLASSCLVAGSGIVGNRVVGATTDNDMGVSNVNLETGAPDASGHLLRPADVHATVLQSMGLPYDHISNQSPEIIKAILK